MAFDINTNVGALNALRNLNLSESQLQKGLQNLSSGLRINNASDDPTGFLQASSQLRVSATATKVVEVINTGIAVSNVALEGTASAGALIQSIKDTAIKGISTINSGGSGAAIKTEIDNLLDQLRQVIKGTTFNGDEILNESQGGRSVQSASDLFAAGRYDAGPGGNAIQIVGLDVNEVDSNISAFRLVGVGGSALKVSGNGGVTQTISLNGQGLEVGESRTYSFENLGVTISLANVGTATLNASAIGAAGASASANLEVAQSPDGAQFQAGVAIAESSIVSVKFGNLTEDNGILAALFEFGGAITASSEGSDFQLLANAADAGVVFVDNLQSRIGAAIRRLDDSVINVQATQFAAEESAGKIRDADFAAETASFTRAQILQQAATSILAQANALPQLALSLLQ